MKKLFFFTTALLAFAVCSNAQNSSPYWSLAGNSNATSSSKLGTTNAINLRLFTNNSERIRVNTSGLVGIGTTAPNSRLHVNSSLGQQAIRAQVNGTTKFLVHNKGGVAIGSGDVPPANGLYVVGNVGIGTAPSAKLHVNFNSTISNPQVLLSETENDYARLNFQNTATSNVFSVAALPAASNADARLNFYYAGRGNIMTVKGDGKVGINTISPVSEEHIVHDFGSISHGLRINQVSSIANSFWNFYVQSTGDLELATQNGIKGIFRASDGVYSPSDKALKKNFEKVESILPKIMQLDVQKYNFLEEKDANLKHYGMMAQDVAKLFPELVLHSKFDGDKDTWLMNYSAFGVLAVKAIQEQQQKLQKQEEINRQQEKKINVLEERLEKLEAALQLSSNNLPNVLPGNVKLANTPNPFRQSTTIRYSLPEGTKGQINIFNEAGSLIKTMTANENGQTLLSSNGLSAGVYTYTLSANGTVLISKKMVIEK